MKTLVAVLFHVILSKRMYQQVPFISSVRAIMSMAFLQSMSLLKNLVSHSPYSYSQRNGAYRGGSRGGLKPGRGVNPARLVPRFWLLRKTGVRRLAPVFFLPRFARAAGASFDAAPAVPLGGF